MGTEQKEPKTTPSAADIGMVMGGPLLDDNDPMLAEIAAEDALESSRKARSNSITAFASLPAVMYLRELWKEKGITEDDPVFLLLESLGLFDMRYQKLNGMLLESLERSDFFHVTMLRELKAEVSKIERFSALMDRIEAGGKAVADSADAMAESGGKLADHLPSMTVKITESAGLIVELGRYQVFFNWLGPTLGVLIGVIVGVLIGTGIIPLPISLK